MRQRKTLCAALILLCIGMSCLPLINAFASKSGKTIASTNRQNNNWEAFDPASKVGKNAITAKDLKGMWKAYEGAFIFGGSANTMHLTRPFIIEVKGETYRRNKSDKFEPFSIQENLLIQHFGENIDSGIINKITSDELTISWKQGANYTRYYYKK
jgi:hypothetical protein